jgi:hypothetical protein
MQDAQQKVDANIERVQAKKGGGARETDNMSAKGKSKSPRRYKKREEMAARQDGDIISAMDHAAYIFAMQRVLGKSQSQALKIAKPEWSDETCAAHAWEWERREDIQQAKRLFAEHLAKHRRDDVIASKNEVLTFLTRAIRTPLSELDENDPLIVEKRIVINSNGSTTTLKKMDTLGAAKVLIEAQEMGDKELGNLTFAEFVKLLRAPGLPKSKDIEADLQVLDAEVEDEING